MVPTSLPISPPLSNTFHSFHQTSLNFYPFLRFGRGLFYEAVHLTAAAWNNINWASLRSSFLTSFHILSRIPSTLSIDYFSYLHSTASLFSLSSSPFPYISSLFQLIASIMFPSFLLTTPPLHALLKPFSHIGVQSSCFWWSTPQYPRTNFWGEILYFRCPSSSASIYYIQFSFTISYFHFLRPYFTPFSVLQFLVENS